MLYCGKITVPKNTPKDNPKEQEVTINEDTLASVMVYFPPGHECLTGFAVFYGNEQIFPAEEGDWVRGHDTLISSKVLKKLPETPCKLKIKAFNEDTTYDHTIYWYLEALPSWFVFSPLYLRGIYTAITGLLERLSTPVVPTRRWRWY